jgi:hypothetical protein
MMAVKMTDRERAIQAIRRGAPLGEVVKCSCHTEPPTRNGCFGVCEDSVAAIIAAFEQVRAEAHKQYEL